MPATPLLPRNDALELNPPTGADIHLTTPGSSFLWAMFALVLFVDLAVAVWTTRVVRASRVWHHFVVINLSIMAVAYFSMASDLGWTPVRTEFGHYQGEGLPRQIFWVRYVDWILSVIFLVLPATLASPLNLGDTLAAVFLAVLTYTLRLVGALTPSTYKWGFFTMSLASSWALLGYLVLPVRRGAATLGGDYGRLSALFAGSAVLFLGVLHPICWALAEGGNVISVTSEMVFYAVIDVLLRPVGLTFFLYRLGALDTRVLGLTAGKYTLDGGVAGTLEHSEKAFRMPHVPHFPKVVPRRGKHDEAPATTPAATTPAATTPVAANPVAANPVAANPPRLSGATVHEQTPA
ncbi:hypothetical protein Q8F55_004821 [Vanrija albida]|uniref:Uncharacterized protein n=1 Tax=Vanrija albida TaxID=181172 RepID=A0ABR3PZW5_9TREE